MSGAQVVCLAKEFEALILNSKGRSYTYLAQSSRYSDFFYSSLFRYYNCDTPTTVKWRKL